MSHRKLWELVALAAVLALILAGCPAPTPQLVEVEKPVVVEKEVVKTVEVEKLIVVTPTPEPGEAEPEPHPITLTWWDFPRSSTAGEQTQPWGEELIALFEAEHPEVSVELELLEWASGWQKIQAAAAADELPDLSYMDMANIGTYVLEDAVEPVEDYLTEEDWEDFYPHLLDYCSFEGRLYAWPLLEIAFGLMVNKTIAEERGVAGMLPSPTGEWTHDQFLEFAKAVTHQKEDGSKVYAIQIHPRTPPWFWFDDNPWYSEDGMYFILNNPSAVESLQLMTDLVNVHEVAFMATGQTTLNFYNGEAVIQFTRPSPVEAVTAQLAKNEEETGVKIEPAFVPPPVPNAVDDPHGYYGVGGIVVYKHQRDADPYRTKMAMEFARMIVTAEPTMAYLYQFGYLPTRESWAVMYEDDPYMAMAYYLRGKSYDLGQCGPCANNRNITAAEVEAALTLQKTPEQALIDMQKQIEPRMDEWRAQIKAWREEQR